MSYFTTYETSVYDCDPPVANGKENTGRWTAEEHRLFLQGLELHGKGWKKIASLIRTRTVVQIRTHAQKYFQKLAKARLTIGGGDGEGFFLGRKKRRKLYNTNLTSNLTRLISSKTSTFPPSSLPLQILHPSSHISPYVVPPSTKLLSSNRNVVKRVLSDALGKYLTPLAFTNATEDPPPQEDTSPSPTSNLLDKKQPPIQHPFGAKDATGPPKWFSEGRDLGDIIGLDLDWEADPGSDTSLVGGMVGNVIFPEVLGNGTGIIRAHSEVWGTEEGYEQELANALIEKEEE
ncbi:hypothetical protein TrST_g1279 [Triparma strigata]|uniref:Uncharacterized protein n=1 Tax=Triparma strigata TaxID=1606541 RepID=A0A9W6ZMT5_9STRA|nr:hypothetical protein TrST_g1279 [Triparma strigata]